MLALQAHENLPDGFEDLGTQIAIAGLSLFFGIDHTPGGAKYVRQPFEADQARTYSASDEQRSQHSARTS